MGLPVGIAYSGGTSSEWLIHAMLNGALPRPEHVAVFHAATGIEHDWTDQAVADVEETCRKEGLRFFRCERPEELLGEHLLSIGPLGRTRAETPPMYVAKDGGGRGQLRGGRCTREFKIAPMRRAQNVWLRELGLPKRIEKWIGFGADEMARAVKSDAKRDVKWETNNYPAIRLGVTRDMQRAQLMQWTGKAARLLP